MYTQKQVMKLLSILYKQIPLQNHHDVSHNPHMTIALFRINSLHHQFLGPGISQPNSFSQDPTSQSGLLPLSPQESAINHWV